LSPPQGCEEKELNFKDRKNMCAVLKTLVEREEGIASFGLVYMEKIG
jgi:hypothetical protein